MIEAFGRSRELVRGNGWQVFGVILAVFAITAIGAVILGVIAAAISDTAAMRILFNVLASTVTAPIGALVAAVIYFRLREIEGTPSTAAQPPPAAPSPAV